MESMRKLLESTLVRSEFATEGANLDPEILSVPQLEKVEIRGYKSIRSLDLALTRINVLVGANGAGKSNFISFFQLLNQMAAGNLQLYVEKKSGADSLLHFGRKKSPRLGAKLNFGRNGYFFELDPTDDNRLVFSKEEFFFNGPYYGATIRTLGTGHRETKAPEALRSGNSNRNIAQYIVPALQSWKVYHFHDTSDSAPMKQAGQVNDNQFLRQDASNLAAFLYLLKTTAEKNYELIRRTVRMVAPFFKDFQLRPNPLDPNTIHLEWQEEGSDYPFRAHHLSDGTLRFICLATVLLQPAPPSTIVIDEPELGLHPYAITVLGSVIKSASKHAQIVISTQSVSLLNEFSADDVIIVSQNNGASEFKRLSSHDLESWLKEYSLGDLWEKNVLGGRPSK